MCVEMGASIKARAISHLEEVTDDGLDAMSASATAAVLLPTTAYTLRLRPPRARDMIDRNVIVALGSDFNPNAHCLAMVQHYNYLLLYCMVYNHQAVQAIVARLSVDMIYPRKPYNNNNGGKWLRQRETK